MCRGVDLPGGASCAGIGKTNRSFRARSCSEPRRGEVCTQRAVASASNPHNFSAGGADMAGFLQQSPVRELAPGARDLQDLARLSGYRVKGLACKLGRSSRWLELFCQRRFALSPHAWLARLRENEIQALALAGKPAKLICQQVGFADTASFCHSLKRPAGCTLRQLRRQNGDGARSRKDNKRGSPPDRARETDITIPY